MSLKDNVIKCISCHTPKNGTGVSELIASDVQEKVKKKRNQKCVKVRGQYKKIIKKCDKVRKKTTVRDYCTKINLK